MRIFIQNAGGGSEYLAPDVTAVDITIEAGFAASTEQMPDADQVNPW